MLRLVKEVSLLVELARVVVNVEKANKACIALLGLFRANISVFLRLVLKSFFLAA